MRLRLIFLPLILIGGLMWFMMVKGFSLAAVWFCEGGWYRFINAYETRWEGMRIPILLVVGILYAVFFVVSVIVGFLARKREVRSGHK